MERDGKIVDLRVSGQYPWDQEIKDDEGKPKAVWHKLMQHMQSEGCYGFFLEACRTNEDHRYGERCSVHPDSRFVEPTSEEFHLRWINKGYRIFRRERDYETHRNKLFAIYLHDYNWELIWCWEEDYAQYVVKNLWMGKTLSQAMDWYIHETS
jgi:hypothetical protein